MQKIFLKDLYNLQIIFYNSNQIFSVFYNLNTQTKTRIHVFFLCSFPVELVLFTRYLSHRIDFESLYHPKFPILQHKYTILRLVLVRSLRSNHITTAISLEKQHHY